VQFENILSVTKRRMCFLSSSERSHESTGTSGTDGSLTIEFIFKTSIAAVTISPSMMIMKKSSQQSKALEGSDLTSTLPRKLLSWYNVTGSPLDLSE
jgi:hypothetical protein